MKSLLLPTALLCTAAIVPGQMRTLAPDLLSPIRGVKDPQPGGTLRGQPVRVDVRLLRVARPGAVLRVRMFEDTVFEAKLEHLEVEEQLANAFHWRGSLVGRPGSEFIFTVVDDGFAGWIFPNDPQWRSLAIQGAPGMYVARELDDAVHQGTSIAVPRAGQRRPASGCNDDPNRFTVLLVYDDRAKGEAGGTAQIKAQLANGIAISNTCLSGSGLPMRFYGVGFLHAGYSSTQHYNEELRRLTRTNDGHMDQVHRWRHTHKADMVHLVIGTYHHNGGGVAYRGCGGMIGYKSAFGVTVWKSIAGLTLTHEMGHNCGAAHDPANVDQKACALVKPYGMGFGKHDHSSFPNCYYFYTVMSYRPKSQCGALWFDRYTRIPRFSSPAQKVIRFNKTHYAGSATQNNKQLLFDTRQTVANWSLHVRGGTNNPPVITGHPAGKTLWLGYVPPGSHALSVTANAQGNTVSYQWRKNGRTISGQTSSRYTLSTGKTTTALAGRYDCVVTTCAGSVTSRPAVITVRTDRRWLVDGGRYGEWFGEDVKNIGDFDRDGYEDFAAAGLGWPTGTARARWVVYSGKTHAILWSGKGVVASGTNAMRFGNNVAGGDVNGDGYSDLVCGDPNYINYRGWLTWVSGKDHKVTEIYLGATGKKLGTDLALLHLDRDSNLDVVAVASDRIYAYSSGADARRYWKPLWNVQPIAGVVPTSLSRVGDVNYDGVDDFVFGLPTADSGKGRWQLRSGKNGALLGQAPGLTSWRHGHSVAGVGDANGDGVRDFVVGSPGQGGNAGVVQLLSGRHKGSVRIAQLVGPAAGRQLGFRVAGTTIDENGDGIPEILASEIPASGNGTVRVLNGKTLATIRTSSGNGSDGRYYGRGIAGFDSNGDGDRKRVDLLVGQSTPSGYGSRIWHFDAAPVPNPPAFTTFGRICPDSQGRLTRVGISHPLPRVNSNCTVTVRAKPSVPIIFELGLQRSNVDLTGVGMPGCRWLVQPFFLFGTSTDGAGHGEFRLPVPDDNGLAGAKLVVQWFPIDFAMKTPLPIVASNGGEIRIGAR